MDRWIDLHLRDANLTPDALAIAHAVSPRTVYRLFARDGETVGSVVRARRLSRARLDLRDAETTVSTIASRWGFADAGHFSRSFRKTYGVTPSEYRATL
jgi:AraC-like DNA-binding protein